MKGLVDVINIDCFNFTGYGQETAGHGSNLQTIDWLLLTTFDFEYIWYNILIGTVFTCIFYSSIDIFSKY